MSTSKYITRGLKKIRVWRYSGDKRRKRETVLGLT